jgi:hypothetical protein
VRLVAAWSSVGILLRSWLILESFEFRVFFCVNDGIITLL